MILGFVFNHSVSKLSSKLQKNETETLIVSKVAAYKFNFLRRCGNIDSQ